MQEPTGGTVEGVVERVVFSNEESAWSVVRLLTSDQRTITVVGNLLGVQPGESLRVQGEWVQDRRFGEQFKASSYLPLQPSTIEGIRRYLGSGLVEGIGEAMAGRIVDHFGLETLEVLEQTPKRLTEVAGIGGVRAGRISDAWQRQRQIKEVMLFLHSHGITPRLAARILQHYGQGAVAALREDPYRLAYDLHGVGFRIADRVAAEIGIERDSPKRAAAGVLHALHETSDNGHVHALRDELIAAAGELLQQPRALVEDGLATLRRADRVVIEDDAVYLPHLFQDEVATAVRLRHIAETAPRPVQIDPERALTWYEGRCGIELAAAQRTALKDAFREKLLVITGGPGTGKTTIINGIVQILELKKCRILLAAPTGRAAKRMQEMTGREAKTIHRLLEYNPHKRGFMKDRRDPLEADLVIVDETSMIDLRLFRNLLEAVPDDCRLILVGDSDQLPSVGPGSVLRDLILAGLCSVVQLQQIFRQEQGSWIVSNAHRVRAGEMPIVSGADDEESDFYFIERGDPESIQATVEELFRRIPRRFGCRPADMQVLTPMQRGELGAVQLNARLQELLNPGSGGLQRGSRVFRRGDRVVQVRNDYQLDVFNGDLGTVLEVDAEEGMLTADFDGREVRYEPGDLDQLIHAYAMSIHKSQGSEFPVVIVPLHTQHFVLLRRNLLYTAITRGKRLVCIVGSQRALELAVRTHEADERRSRLVPRIRALA
ncbi:MAG: ATP-dependent RecD-like DNA helicase [Planctomycetota bacterium]